MLNFDEEKTIMKFFLVYSGCPDTWDS